MPELAKKEKCTGCAACFNKCPFEAIYMKADYTGFLYPVIDNMKCTNCNGCEIACPVLNNVLSKSNQQRAYIAQNKDNDIRIQSTSGGVFTAIASETIKRGGVVFGASFDDNYYVKHTVEDNINNLQKYRNSKYVQSEIGHCYKIAEEYLKQKILVCFSGTPCQIQGLKKYLSKDYDNLITVDFMCRAVPSPKVFHKYLLQMENKYPSIKKVVFRDKARGYSYSTLSFYDSSNKNLYRGGSEYDQWLRIFFEGYCNRESCYKCQFQTGSRVSDFTLWDCWGTSKYAPEFDDNKGTTNIIVWTKKGQELFNSFRDNLRLKEIGIDAIDASLERGVLPRPIFERNEFWIDVESLSPEAFFNKYVPISGKVKLKSCMRQIIWRLHLHNIIRKGVHWIRRNRK